jgi:vacuolar-type H+-ATPase subunit E/Vma4
MRSHQSESSNAQKKIAETEKKIEHANARQAQEEFATTFEEMTRSVMSRATAEIELGVKLTRRLGASRSLPDVVSAYQEWLSEEMKARSEDARQFMTNSQKFITASTRIFSNGGSGLG